MTSDLSRRGADLVENAPLPPYIRVHFERVEDAYDPRTNPDGYLGLAIAENKLVWPLLEPRLTAARDVPPEAVAYDDMLGNERFRDRLGGFLARHLTHRRFEASQIGVLAGSGSVLEALFYVIADPGDGVLIPTPSYAGFWADLETRDELTVVPVHTTPEEGFRLTPDHLDRVADAATVPIRALLYTNPSNPLGTVASPDEVAAVIDWADDRGIHLVVDEVFALSTFDGEFTSASRLRPELGPRRHLVWAFSKDFGASGLRCGVLVSENEDVMAAIDGLAYWATVSGDTQHLLSEMIADEAWVEGYLAGMRSTLGEAYRTTASALSDAGIGHVPASAGVFTVLDLREFLDEPTWEAEDRLWRRILGEANVNVTPGAACRIVEPGFVRLVYATEPAAHVVTGVERMAGVLRG